MSERKGERENSNGQPISALLNGFDSHFNSVCGVCLLGFLQILQLPSTVYKVKRMSTFNGLQVPQVVLSVRRCMLNV